MTEQLYTSFQLATVTDLLVEAKAAKAEAHEWVNLHEGVKGRLDVVLEQVKDCTHISVDNFLPDMRHKNREMAKNSIERAKEMQKMAYQMRSIIHSYQEEEDKLRDDAFDVLEQLLKHGDPDEQPVLENMNIEDQPAHEGEAMHVEEEL